MIGKTLSHYRILEKIGSGGMGDVYRAHDERLDRDVAVKVLPSGTLADEKARKRFRKEALTLSKLNHPHIATVFDFDTQDGVDFIVMELIEGMSLAEKLKAGALPEKELSELGGQIADALEEAHERGVVHRDLKPGNIALTPKGRVKVLDFGLSRMLQPVSDEASTEAMSETHAVAGTLPYMSPEELRGERADHRSDIYSFGVVLYEMATGRRPFEEKLSTRLTDAILHQAPKPPSTHNREISPGLEGVILKALDRDPEHRYQSAREMRVDLERLTTPVPLKAPKRKKAARGWMWAAGAMAVVAVVVAVGVYILSRGEAPEIDSIAVLPLENLSGDPEQEFFADGMTEALITDLAKIGALKVISRTSTMRFKDTDEPIPDIAKLLNVDAVIEGSVLRDGDRVRITAQLIHAETDQHLWAESYERDLRDVLALQSEVARAVAREIQITLTPLEKERFTNTRVVDPAAHESYLKGRYFWNLRSEGGLMRGIEFFQRAISQDPNYALAHAGLADSYFTLAAHSILPPKEALLKAKSAAMKALEIDDTLAEAHASLAFVYFWCDRDWSEAEREFERAIELNPSYSSAHQWYAEYLAAMGRLDQAIAEARQAQQLDLLSPMINFDLGEKYYYSRRYDLSTEQLRETLELEPELAIARYVLGMAYIQESMFDEAIVELQKAVVSSQGRPWFKAGLGLAYGSSGEASKALEILDELKKPSSRQHVSPFDLASVYLGLGETEKALDELAAAYEEGTYILLFLKVDPQFDPLRDEPRFQELLRKMNFPD